MANRSLLFALMLALAAGFPLRAGAEEGASLAESYRALSQSGCQNLGDCDSKPNAMPSAAGTSPVRRANVPTPPERPAGLGTKNPSVNANESTGNASTNTQIESAISACESEGQSTVDACSTDRGSDSMAGAYDAADSAARSMSASPSTQSVSACENIANATSAANAAMAAVKSRCAFAYDSCQSACSEATSLINKLTDPSQKADYRSRLTDAKRQCNSAQSRLQGIEQNMQQVAAGQQRSQNCLNDIGAQNLAKQQAELQQRCMANPSASECVTFRQDCTNPQFAATNPVCQGLANGAGLPRGSGSSSSGGGLDGAAGSAANAANAADQTGAFGTGNQFAPVDIPAKPPGTNDLRGDSSGGGGRSGEGANKPGEKYRGNAGGSGLNTNVIAGRYGGAGGTFGSYQRPSASGSYAANGSWIPPKVGTRNGLAGVDINKFRPNMAGYRLPNDAGNGSGLLAAHVNIWRQMNLRYLSVAPTLKP